MFWCANIDFLSETSGLSDYLIGVLRTRCSCASSLGVKKYS